jgi:hypothetical protein
VQKFEKLHLHAERSLFGLRNRKVFEEFGLFLNTALEIVEEVTSRCSTYTQDLEYATCYGQLHSRLLQQDGQHWQEEQHQQQQQQQCEEHAAFATSAGIMYGYGYDYDYSECADPLNDGVESTHQMLSYFDQKHQQLYHEQQEQQEQQEQTGLNLDTYEEGVIVEGVNGGEDEKKEESTTNTIATKTTSESEDTTENKKKGGKGGGWLSSWF